MRPLAPGKDVINDGDSFDNQLNSIGWVLLFLKFDHINDILFRFFLDYISELVEWVVADVDLNLRRGFLCAGELIH